MKKTYRQLHKEYRAEVKHYESLDKRTKEYKLWIKDKEAIDIKTTEKRTKAYKDSIKNKAPLGLGDVVEKITKATGIKAVVEAFTPEGKDCGCDKRKKKLNLNYELGITKTKVLRCMTETQYKAYGKFMNERTLTIDRKQIQFLIDLYAHVFALQYNIGDFCTNCGGAVKRINSIQEKLDKVHKTYK